MKRQKAYQGRWVWVGALAFVLLLPGSLAIAQTPAGEHWVATWAASPQEARPPRPQSPQPPIGFDNQTVRMIVHTTLGGNRVRVQLSNEFGARPLDLAAAHIALRAKDSTIVPGSDRALTFNGKPSCSIPPGAPLISDPVDLAVPQSADLAISVYVPFATGPPTMHATGLHTTYISKQGDYTAQPMPADAATTKSWYWLESVDVLAPANTGAVVTLGDSITDGAVSTPDTDRSWPSVLAQRLLANPSTANLAVVNEGISGNRVLRDGAGVSALARFDRDVLGHPSVKWLMVMEGINDIGLGLRANTPAADAITSEDLIAGLRQIADRAHLQGLRVIGCTLTPFGGAAYYSDAGETVREAVNHWILTSGTFDAVVDFDAVIRDPANPKQFRPGFNNGDHLHPNDAGYKAMADAVDLSIFGASPARNEARSR